MQCREFDTEFWAPKEGLNISLIFRDLYDKTALPFRIESTVKGNRIKWSKKVNTTVYIQSLDIVFYLPIFFDGIRDCDTRYSDIAYQASMETIDALKLNMDHKLLRYLIPKVRLGLHCCNLKVLMRYVEILIALAKCNNHGMAKCLLVEIGPILYPLSKAYNLKIVNKYDFAPVSMVYRMDGLPTLRQKIQEFFNILEIECGHEVNKLLTTYIPCYRSELITQTSKPHEDEDCLEVFEDDRNTTDPVDIIISDPDQEDSPDIDQLIEEPFSSKLALKQRGTMVVMQMKSEKQNRASSNYVKKSEDKTERKYSTKLKSVLHQTFKAEPRKSSMKRESVKKATVAPIRKSEKLKFSIKSTRLSTKRKSTAGPEIVTNSTKKSSIRSSSRKSSKNKTLERKSKKMTKSLSKRVTKSINERKGQDVKSIMNEKKFVKLKSKLLPDSQSIKPSDSIGRKSKTSSVKPKSKLLPTRGSIKTSDSIDRKSKSSPVMSKSKLLQDNQSKKPSHIIGRKSKSSSVKPKSKLLQDNQSIKPSHSISRKSKSSSAKPKSKLLPDSRLIKPSESVARKSKTSYKEIMKLSAIAADNIKLPSTPKPLKN